MSHSDPRALQLWEPDPIMLAGLFAASPNSGSVDFIVPIPDSRLRVKVSLLYIILDSAAAPSGATSISINGNHTLWLAAREYDRSGRRGNTVPVQNIEGTIAAPTVICPNDGTLLLGYSREFVTAADEIFGRLAVNCQDLTPGRWMLQCRYQPDGLQMDPCEWEKIWPKCTPQASTPPIVFPGTGS